MSRFLAGVMAVVLIAAALLVGYLSCSSISIGAVASFLTGIPELSTCYALFPPMVGTILSIIFTALGVVALAAVTLG